MTGPAKNRSRLPVRGRETSSTALSDVRSLLGESPRRRDLLVEYLHRIQDRYGCLRKDHLLALAEELRLSGTEVYEVATFYHHFTVVESPVDTPPPITVRVCQSLTCAMYGGASLLAELEKRLSPAVRVLPAPCVGRCHSAPVAVVHQNPIDAASVDQVRRAVEQQAVTAPGPAAETLDPYCRDGGYKLLQRCQAGRLTRDEIIGALKDSRLRGLGGAGFPAGTKWEILRNQPKPRLIAVNIDEGEPGTFKDRYYLERSPHRFLEGALIAAWAIEAEAVYIYLRDEYAACRALLEREIAALEKSPPCTLPPLYLRRGAGAYICGEESAMLESIEGRRGEPRHKPPYPSEVGLFGRPTLIHNVETLY
ncbi:MAG: NAD(P)H-dependent oxidoreductase subunit E, partial [Gammaproteobacteria bacterium]|nr:NAD(P)H-dependent oxidoreductase subunit E [Gammaproteobacteria bacterium]